MRRYVLDIDFSLENILRYQETFTQDFYPCFFVREQTNGWVFGYGEKDKAYSEFMEINIDTTHKTVSVERDVKATLILFYYFHEQRLIISSDYNYFAQQLDVRNTINQDYLKLMLWNGKTGNASICQHIFPLYPRKIYHFSRDWLTVIPVTYTPQKITLEDMLHQNFCHLTDQNIVWAEISGWKDSAFLPILSKKATNFPFRFVSGQLHTWVVWETQWQTISGILNFLQLPYEYHLITPDDYPLKNDPVGMIHHPVEEIYKNSVLWEIAIFKKHRINTVFTGFWGDEAFENSADPESDFVAASDDILSELFTQQLIDDVHALNARPEILYIDGIFPPSVYDSLISRNNLFIQHWIWPITPYLNIDAYAYFQWLYVTKQQFFGTFYEQFDPQLIWVFAKNTNMAEYFRQYFRSEYFNNLLQSCVSSTNPLVHYYNQANLKSLFADTRTCDEALIEAHDFALYNFVYMSLMLK